MEIILLKSFFQLIAMIFMFFSLSNLAVFSIPDEQSMSINWPEIVIQLCFASAMEICLLQVQIGHSQLPLTLRLVSVTNFFAFASILLAIFVARRHPVGADVLEKAAIFFFVTTFFLSVTIPFPLTLKCIAWFIYLGSSVALFLDNCSPHPPTLANWIEVRSRGAMFDTLIKYGPPPS